MQRRAFGRGDDIGRGAGARGFGDFDGLRGAERLGNARDRLDGLGKMLLWKYPPAMAMRKPPMSCASSGVTGSAGRVVHAASSASGPCIAS